VVFTVTGAPRQRKLKSLANAVPLAFALQQRFKAVCECFGFIFPVEWHAANVHTKLKKI
jgi:hypothetical protein